jgi:uncharacterized protein (DUF1015 family)
MKLLPFYPYIADKTAYTSFSGLTGNAKNLYLDFVADGWVKPIDKECVIVYRINTPNGSYSGLVALNDYDDYAQILGHEKTLIQKEDDHINNMKKIKTMIKPVLIGYQKSEAIDKSIDTVMIQNPDFIFNDDENQDTHELWICQDYAVIQELFDHNVDTCYIADGHHRYAISKYLKDNHLIEGADFKGLLCFYMSFDQLKIYEYNRILPLDGMTFSSLQLKLEKVGNLTQLAKFQKPTKKFQLTIIHNRSYYSFEWNNEFLPTDAEMVFDVDLFNSYILEDIFHIEDARLLGSNNFIEGIVPIDEIEDRVKKQKEVVFIFYPIQAEELMQNALEGNYLPPKSTWFYPRIKSGLINSKF